MLLLHGTGSLAPARARGNVVSVLVASAVEWAKLSKLPTGARQRGQEMGAREARAAEAPNPKSKARNPKQTRMTESEHPQQLACAGDSGFRACFGFRVSA
jgi:hypothetical protein